MKRIRLPRGAVCVFAGDGSRQLATRDAAGRLWVDHRDAGGEPRRGRVPSVETARTPGAAATDEPILRAPTAGRVTRVAVEAGAEVAAGELCAVIELMKMELRVAAPRAGRVAAVHVRAGDAVERGAPLLTLEL